MTLKSYREKIMNGISILLFTAAGVMFFLFVVFQIPAVQEMISTVEEALREFEQIIISIENKWIALIVLAILFILRAWVPFFPISALCLISGALFPMPYSFLINLGGIVLMNSFAYNRGVRQGGGAFQKFMEKYEGAWELVEHYGRGNPLLLFITRLTPVVPLNSTSIVYGSLRFPFGEYTFISLGGFAPRLIGYTFIGRNVFNPFSFSFIGPIVALLVLSGAVVLSVNKILARIHREKKQSERDKRQQESKRRQSLKK